jgi:hypothetical protein
MFRIYCDNNIYQYLKKSHPKFNCGLQETLNALRDKFLFVFSDAHLDDLRNSTNEQLTKEDLLRIESYCLNNYFSYDHIGTKSLKILLGTPEDAFKRKYGDAKPLGKLDLNNLFEEDEDDPLLKSINGFIKSLLSLPISFFGQPMDLSNADVKTKELFDKMLPGYSPNMTMNEFMNGAIPYGESLLNDKKEFTELRKLLSDYVDSNDYSFSNWGMKFDQKLKESLFGKSFLEILELSLTEEQKNNAQYSFNFAYSLLEIYGIAQERTNSGLKKFTYDSMDRDASHAFFASYCDYLVTDDRGLQVKASILYNLFGIKTEVLSTQDFINKRSVFLANEETHDSFFKSLDYDLKHSLQLFEGKSLDSGITYQELKVSHSYFNYFNRLQVLSVSNAHYLLYCYRGVQGGIYIYRELIILSEKMIASFGSDDDDKGIVTLDEAETVNDNESIRSWSIYNIILKLLIVKTQSGKHIVLSIKEL